MLRLHDSDVLLQRDLLEAVEDVRVHVDGGGGANIRNGTVNVTGEPDTVRGDEDAVTGAVSEVVDVDTLVVGAVIFY